MMIRSSHHCHHQHFQHPKRWENNKIKVFTRLFSVHRKTDNRSNNLMDTFFRYFFVSFGTTQWDSSVLIEHFSAASGGKTNYVPVISIRELQHTSNILRPFLYNRHTLCQTSFFVQKFSFMKIKEFRFFALELILSKLNFWTKIKVLE